MGFTKEIIRNGNGSKPSVGQTVTGMYVQKDYVIALSRFGECSLAASLCIKCIVPDTEKIEI